MSLSILAVDDSLTMRTLIRADLEAAGFAVETAVDGEDGLAAFQRQTPDLVITDINMPKMNGFELIEALRGGARPTAVPILVLTTESAPELKQRAREAGATGWIVKPFESAAMRAAIRRVAG